jgi:hypothetical protein
VCVGGEREIEIRKKKKSVCSVSRFSSSPTGPGSTRMAAAHQHSSGLCVYINILHIRVLLCIPVVGFSPSLPSCFVNIVNTAETLLYTGVFIISV